MAQLIVRNVDDAIAVALKARAANSGRSAEAEHRRILEEALLPRTSNDFQSAVRARRVRLSDLSLSTTDILRQDRNR